MLGDEFAVSANSRSGSIVFTVFDEILLRGYTATASYLIIAARQLFNFCGHRPSRALR
jgi:hypothetical protein